MHFFSRIYSYNLQPYTLLYQKCWPLNFVNVYTSTPPCATECLDYCEQISDICNSIYILKSTSTEPTLNSAVTQFQFLWLTLLPGIPSHQKCLIQFHLRSSEHSIFSTQSQKVSITQCADTTVILICLMQVGLTRTCNLLH